MPALLIRFSVLIALPLDPIFLSIFTDIFAALASSSASNVYQTVVKRALPSLCTAIGSAKPEESWIAGSAIDLVSSLVKGAPENGLGDGFFALLAPNLFECLKHAEDRDVLQVRFLSDHRSSLT
jgi:importin-9